MRERVKHAEYVDGALMALASVTDISKFAFCEVKETRSRPSVLLHLRHYRASGDPRGQPDITPWIAPNLTLISWPVGCI